jgi:hypothetical protein
MQIDSSEQQSENAMLENLTTIEGDSNVIVVRETFSPKANEPSS